MITVVITVAALVADLAIGMAAYKMSKSNTTTNVTLLSLLSKHGEVLADHGHRIVRLEQAA